MSGRVNDDEDTLIVYLGILILGHLLFRSS